VVYPTNNTRGCIAQGNIPVTHICPSTCLQAGNAAARFLGLTPAARVIPVEPDEPQVAAAKDLLRTQRQVQQLVVGSLGSAFAGLTGSSRLGSTIGGVRVAAAAGAARVAARRDAGVAASTSSIAEADSSRSRRSSPQPEGLSLLQQDEQLQELLRDEVIEQVTEQDRQQRQQQQKQQQQAQMSGK